MSASARRHACGRAGDGGITAPAGFAPPGCTAGSRKRRARSRRHRRATSPSAAAACSPPIWRRPLRSPCRERHLDAPRGRARAVVVNSGCANACTGARRPARRPRDGRGRGGGARLRRRTGAGRIDRRHRRRPADGQGACRACRRRRRPRRAAGQRDAARAIMTTDPFPKEHAVAVPTPRGHASPSAARPRARA